MQDDGQRPIWERPLNPRRFWKLAMLLSAIGFGFAASVAANRGEYAKASFDAIVALSIFLLETKNQ
jgi:uncharacterized membrane protein